MPSFITFTIMDALVALLSVWLIKTKPSNLPLPLGPRHIPFLGTLDIDISKPHVSDCHVHAVGASLAV